MSNLGAHGQAASFSGSNGMKHGQGEGGFAHMGAKEGNPSPTPESAKSGSRECDASCRQYTGNPRDQAGRYPAPGAAPQPRASAAGTNITHGRMGKR